MTPAYDPLYLYIDGQWLKGEGRETRPVYNPATGAIIAELPVASSADLEAALSASARGFQFWRQMPALHRGQILQKAAALLRERLSHVAVQMVLEQGKLLREAEAEVTAAADFFDWYGEEAKRAYGRVIPARELAARHLALLEPVGPVAAFSPWNFPAVAPARKIAAALAAGCSCILKAAEETPATALHLARALHDAGLPPGVLNLVFGDPAQISTHLIRSEVIRKVSFTGSTAVGRQIAQLAAEGVKRASLELGGHAPVIICDDADPEAAAALAVAAKSRNAGQVCVSPTRYIVADQIYDRFAKAFTQGLARLTIGPGLSPSSDMGPLANARRPAAVARLIDDAIARGGKILTGGLPGKGPGYAFAPTLLADLPTAALARQEEPFGPIAVLSRFDHLDDALAEANRLPYGLAAYLFTPSARRAHDLSAGLEAGMIGINSYAISMAETPFGGVKHSGYGEEGGIEGLKAYQSIKFIAHH